MENLGDNSSAARAGATSTTCNLTSTPSMIIVTNHVYIYYTLLITHLLTSLPRLAQTLPAGLSLSHFLPPKSDTFFVSVFSMPF